MSSNVQCGCEWTERPRYSFFKDCFQFIGHIKYCFSFICILLKLLYCFFRADVDNAESRNAGNVFICLFIYFFNSVFSSHKLKLNVLLYLMFNVWLFICNLICYNTASPSRPVNQLEVTLAVPVPLNNDLEGIHISLRFNDGEILVLTLVILVP